MSSSDTVPAPENLKRLEACFGKGKIAYIPEQDLYLIHVSPKEMEEKIMHIQKATDLQLLPAATARLGKENPNPEVPAAILNALRVEGGDVPALLSGLEPEASCRIKGSFGKSAPSSTNERS